MTLSLLAIFPGTNTELDGVSNQCRNGWVNEWVNEWMGLYVNTPCTKHCIEAKFTEFTQQYLLSTAVYTRHYAWCWWIEKEKQKVSLIVHEPRFSGSTHKVTAIDSVAWVSCKWKNREHSTGIKEEIISCVLGDLWIFPGDGEMWEDFDSRQSLHWTRGREEDPSGGWQRDLAKGPGKDTLKTEDALILLKN